VVVNSCETSTLGHRLHNRIFARCPHGTTWRTSRSNAIVILRVRKRRFFILDQRYSIAFPVRPFSNGTYCDQYDPSRVRASRIISSSALVQNTCFLHYRSQRWQWFLERLYCRYLGMETVARRCMESSHNEANLKVADTYFNCSWHSKRILATGQ
jgi:hypothetical protein